MGNESSAPVIPPPPPYEEFASNKRPLPPLPGTLQRSLTSKRFKGDTMKTLQWKIFNELDIQDDKMMLELAMFLQRLVTVCPQGEGGKEATAVLPVLPVAHQRGEAEQRAVDTAKEHFLEEENFAVDIENLTITDDDKVTPSIVRIGSVDVKIGINEDLMDYNLGEEFSADTVDEVLQLYASDGRLSTKSMRRVLRGAYKLFRTLPNLTSVPMEPGVSVTVVGDLHGQFEDLYHLLEVAGRPGPTHKIVFNGDFVDRGAKGVEVLVVLFLLFQVFPQYTFLNRGNHEDFGLCSVYGFQKECVDKYDQVVFSMCAEIFRYLPLATVIEDQILVVHGGLFHREGVTLDDINAVDRLEYKVPQSRPEMDVRMMNREEDLEVIGHCILWSDPDIDDCLPQPQPNPRGAGVLFGPDMARSFLLANKLKMVVRSHECVEQGFDQPYEGEMEGACATVFSASNYGGSMNKGAIITFSRTDSDISFEAGGEFANLISKPPIYYVVTDYQLARHRDPNGLSKANMHGLSTLVLRKKKLLAECFAQLDRNGTGVLSIEKWASAMGHVTGLQIAWEHLIGHLVAKEDMRDGMVVWKSFLSKFHVQLKGALAQGKNATTGGGALFSALYSNRERLEAIFMFFDTDKNGSISRDEFRRGCELINKHAPEGERLEDPDRMLDLIDLDANDSIEINEFFEVFRLMNPQITAVA